MNDYNGAFENWRQVDIILYCQIGSSVDLADFAIKSAIDNAGLNFDQFDIFLLLGSRLQKLMFG